MATIVWINEQGETVRSHTLDPAGTKQEIEERGGRIVDVERPQEAKPHITYHRDSSGRVTHITKVSTVIGEEPEPTPVVEPEEEPERKKYVGPPLPPIEYQRYKDITPALRPAPPIPEPSVFERPGITAPFEVAKELPLRPRVPEVKTEKEIREEQEAGISRAETRARLRITEEREIFEERERPLAQDVTQQKYNELISRKATELGMVWDAGQGVWIGNESQIERFREYEPEARVQSMTFGTDFYQRQWEEFGLGDRAGEIYEEEFARGGFVLVEKDGTFTVVPEKEFKRRERVLAERERIRERVTGTPEERISELTRFVSLSVLKPISVLAPIVGEAVLGGREKGERILDIYAGRVEELEGKGIGEVAISSYLDPGGLGFIGTAAALFAAGTAGLGRLTGAGGQIIQKGIPAVVGGAIVTVAGAEIGITAAREKPFDPTKGLEQIPAALLTGEAGKKVIQFGAAISLFVGFGALAAKAPILPKVQREIVFEPETGVITQQRFFDVFGRQVRIPGVKQFQILDAAGIPSRVVPSLPSRTIGFPGAAPTTVADVSKAVVSISQIRGVKQVTFDVAKGTFEFKRITPKKVSPLDIKFKPPKEMVKSAEEILFKTKLDVDLFKKAERVLVQKKITDLPKERVGKFLIGDVTLKLEKTPFLVGTKPIGKPVKPEPRTVGDLSKWKITEADEKRFLRERELASEKLRMFRTQKVVGLKDLFKQPPLQKRIFEEFRIVAREGKPIVRKLIPEPKKIIDIEEIVKPKPLVKTMQTSLDKLFKLPSFEVVKGVITKAPPSKPIRFKLTDAEKTIVSKTDTTVTLLKKIDVKTSVRDLDLDVISKKQVGVTEETLRKLGRFEPDEFVRMFHPKAPKGVVKPTDRLELLVAPIVGRITETDISQVKATGELSGRLMQIGRVSVLERAVSKMTDVQQRTELRMTQGILQSSVSIQDILSGERQVQVQAQTQAQIQKSMLRTVTILIGRPEITLEPPPVEPPVGPPVIGFEQDLMKGVSLTPQAYDVFVYKTQFRDGKRIRGKEEVKLNKRPLRRLDALALGSDLVDNTAKRTIILKKAEGKPTKLKKKVYSWTSQMFEYNAKGNDVFVEKNIHAIDSPGEIQEITMKGIAARRRGGKQSNSGVPRDFSNVGMKMNREMNRIGRRLII